MEAGRATLLVLLLFTGLSVASPVGLPGRTLILTDGINSAYLLEHNLLVAGTDTVFVDGRQLAAREYALDIGHGTIVFESRPEAYSAILVLYRHIPFYGGRGKPNRPFAGETRLGERPAIPTPVYRLRRTAEQDSGQAAIPVKTGEPEIIEVMDDSDIAVSGDKSIGVSLGGLEGGGINQSTRLSVRGTLEGVDIEAELSDQSTGIPAEGTTREVEELDRIAVRLTGRGWQAGFGDVEIGLEVPGFGHIGRRAVGAVVEVKKPESDFATKPQSHDGKEGREEVGSKEEPSGLEGVWVGYARPRGEFGRVSLSGRDGVQGPYVLAPDGRQAQLVPGSEKVHLDGKRMVRGWDADYTVDYSTGEVVFTNRQVIDRSSRVEASFQYVVGAYERSNVAAGASAGAGPVRVRAGFFREGDDPNRAYDEELSAGEREYLSGIGGDTSRAWLEGGRYAGSGNGAYVKEPEGWYRYAGEKQGDYEVIFTLAGDSAGDYVYDDTLFAYRFVGEKHGDYRAKRRVVLPRRDEFVTAGAGAEGMGLSADVTGVFRRSMANLFARDGTGMDAGAVAAAAGWKAGAFGLSYAGRVEGDGFHFGEEEAEPDFEYRWGGATQREMRSSNEFAAEADVLDDVRLKTEAGLLERMEKPTVARLRAAAGYKWLAAELGRVMDESRYELRAGPQLGRLTPTLGASLRARPDEWRQKVEAGAEVKVTESGTAAASHRYDDVSGPDSTGVRIRRETGGLSRVSVGWNPKDEYRLDAGAARQSRRYESDPSKDWTQWLIDVTGSASPWPGISARADISQSYRLIQLRDEVFRFVGGGRGGYSRDTLTGRYYPDSGGDYERALVAKGRFASCRERNVNASAEAGAWQPASFYGSVSLTSAADSAPLQELERYTGRVTVRKFEPILRAHTGASGSRSMDRTLAATGRDARRRDVYLELGSEQMSGYSLRGRMENYSEVRMQDGVRAGLAEQGWRLSLDPIVGRERWYELELSLTAGWAWFEGVEPAFRLLTQEVGVARGLVLEPRTKAKLTAGFVHRVASVSELPFEVGLTRPTGWTPSASVEFSRMLSDILTGSAQYRFSDRPDRAAEHRLSAELRARF